MILIIYVLLITGVPQIDVLSFLTYTVIGIADKERNQQELTINPPVNISTPAVLFTLYLRVN